MWGLLEWSYYPRNKICLQQINSRTDWDAGFVEGRQYGRGKTGGQVWLLLKIGRVKIHHDFRWGMSTGLISTLAEGDMARLYSRSWRPQMVSCETSVRFVKHWFILWDFSLYVERRFSCEKKNWACSEDNIVWFWAAWSPMENMPTSKNHWAIVEKLIGPTLHVQ